jgi:uncharacterized protein (TIGR03435 family)
MTINIKPLLLSLFFGCVAVEALSGQPLADQHGPSEHKFAAASIRPATHCDDGAKRPGNISPGRLELSCFTARTLIRAAYGPYSAKGIAAPRIEVLGGPSWLDTERYTVSATADNGAGIAEMLGPMLQALLAERFKTSVHKELRDTPVYKLIVAASSEALRPAPPDSCAPTDPLNPPSTKTTSAGARYCGTADIRGNGLKITGEWRGITMDEFANRELRSWVDRPVLNATGLLGRFDLRLEFTSPPAGLSTFNGEVASQTTRSTEDQESAPTIFNALRRQLGLSLSPTKGAVEVLVVNHAEKPSEN